MSPIRRSIRFLAVPMVLAACSHDAPRPAAGTLALTDDWARSVHLTAPARRIVSLAPATTELVFALGLGDRLVGRTTWCDYPAAARAVADVGNGMVPNVEAVAARRPDLVLLYASEANRPALQRFEALGIPVLALKVDLAADVRRAAQLVSAAAGVPAAGDSLVARYDSALSAARVDGVRPLKVYVDVQGNPPITIGRASYLSEIITDAGGRNVFSDVLGASGPVSLEAIVRRNPDVVLVFAADSTRSTRLAGRPGWQAVPAVREGRVLVLDSGLYGRPSPRMPEAVRGLAARLQRIRALLQARRPQHSSRAGRP